MHCDMDERASMKRNRAGGEATAAGTVRLHRQLVDDTNAGEEEGGWKGRRVDQASPAA
jgi:hypothetical protein